MSQHDEQPLTAKPNYYDCGFHTAPWNSKGNRCPTCYMNQEVDKLSTVEAKFVTEKKPVDPRMFDNMKPSNPKDIIGTDKAPLHLFPNTAIAWGSLSMLEGLLKYGRSNFREVGIRASVYYDALERHMKAWFEGEEIDPDSGLPHLAKALACVAILIDAKAAGKLEDDRMYPGGFIQTLKEITPHVKRLRELHKDKNPKHYTIKDKA